MKKEDFEDFSDMIDCYFNQDFDYMYENIEDAMKEIIQEFSEQNIISLYHQINEILKISENEKNLEDILNNKFQIQVTPQVGGDDMNTYTELLEYIRDHIKEYLKTQNINIS